MHTKPVQYIKRALFLLLVVALLCPPIQVTAHEPPVAEFTIINGALVDVIWHGDENEDIIVPDGVVEISEWAFSVGKNNPMRTYTRYARTIVIPDSVKRIGEYAFSGMAFTDIILPDSVISIAANAFNDELYPDTVVIPDRADSSAVKAQYTEENKDTRLPANSFVCNIDEEGYITVFREFVVDLTDYNEKDNIQPMTQDTIYTTALLDPAYNLVLDFVVDAVWPKPILFFNGYAVVQTGSTAWTRNTYPDRPVYTHGNGKYGIIDRTGTFVAAPDFYRISYLGEDMYELQETEYGYVYNQLPIVNIQDIVKPPSTWAQAEVQAAQDLRLVSPYLRYQYTNSITRAEFCLLVVAAYEKLTGSEISIIDPETGFCYERVNFYDAIGIDVQKAAAIGVVNGVANQKFDPTAPLTREQAATILALLATALNKPFIAQAPTFADSGSIASWAKQAVGAVQNTGIMVGVGNNNFAPKDAYTREQSIVTILRLYEYAAAA